MIAAKYTYDIDIMHYCTEFTWLQAMSNNNNADHNIIYGIHGNNFILDAKAIDNINYILIINAKD